MVLHTERVPGNATYISEISHFPNHGFEKMIAPNFEVSWCCAAGPSSHHDVFGRGLEKVIDDFVGATGIVPTSASNGLGITASNNGSAMKVREKRVYDRG